MDAGKVPTEAFCLRFVAARVDSRCQALALVAERPPGSLPIGPAPGTSPECAFEEEEHDRASIRFSIVRTA
jgi:hypothetical protein